MYSSQRISPNAAFCSLLISIAFCFISPFTAQSQSVVKGAKQLQAHFLGKTAPLRELAPLSATAPGKLAEAKKNKPKIAPPNFSGFPKAQKRAVKALPLGEDPVRQIASGENSGIIVVPKVVIEGIDEATTEIQVPDTNGDISPESYIQTVNASYFQIFGKDGTPLGAPISTNTLWSQINRSSFGDPVILYDADAGRWLLTDLASFDEVLYAVSETGDPLGSWFIYSFLSDGFTDYPKYGIWPNAYILTVGDFTSESPVLAINRAQMLAGASQVDVQKLGIPVIPNGGYPMMTPMGWSGNTPAANNAKPAFLRIHDDAWGNITTDQVEIWTMDIDWADPANTSLSPQFLTTAPFDSDPCTYQNVGYQCVPQPNSDMGIDAIATIITNKVTYRNFGTHEGAVLTFTVDAADNVAGIRWIELRRTAGSSDWSVYQEGTFAPNDGLQRFIGSVALNDRGDIGLGYAVSSTDKFPSLRFTGRRATDPLGEMTVEEF